MSVCDICDTETKKLIPHIGLEICVHCYEDLTNEDNDSNSFESDEPDESDDEL
jgi:hypothetical protein